MSWIFNRNGATVRYVLDATASQRLKGNNRKGRKERKEERSAGGVIFLPQRRNGFATPEIFEPQRSGVAVGSITSDKSELIQLPMNIRTAFSFPIFYFHHHFK